MMRFDFVTLRLFIAIADERSLTAAANRENMALAAVSKRISDLESQVGSPLLYRRPRGVELTPAGHALLHHARNVFDQLRHLSADLSEYSEGVRGHVRLHANTSAIIQFLPEDLSRFSTEHPGVKIDLEEKLSTEVIAALKEDLTDIGIFAGHMPSGDLHTFPYRTDQLVLVIPKGHPLAGRDTILLSEASEYDFIGLEQGSSLHQLVTKNARQLGKNLHMRIQVRSFEGILQMIDKGMGVGVLPEKSVHSHLPSLDIDTIALRDAWARRELVIGVKNPDDLSTISKQMLSHLTEKPEL
ncbi:LysR family transcriptional regulator [Litchfieldella rifensis]|uniref:LysR family transcriptional regulator n=1 Tax=Litchfieldella rifensis TaxID=762643 RepID=A0ABV7LU00_9GAMM